MIKTANKRMFSLAVVDTDTFLEMPTSAQALYFHLCLRADDDGFVGSAKRICRTVGANEDDLKLLIAKRFILIFEDGVIVIKHWRMHNTLSKGRYTETRFLEYKAQLRLKDNNAYTISGKGHEIDDSDLIQSRGRSPQKQLANNGRTFGEQLANNGRTFGEQLANPDKIRKDKNRIEENRKEEKKNEKRFESDRLEKAFNEFLLYQKKIGSLLTDQKINLFVEKINTLSDGNDERAIKIINQSIMHGWKGLYPLDAKEIERDKAQEIKDLETQLLRS